MKVQFQHVAAIFYGMTIVTACATQGRRDFSVAPSGAFGVISEPDIVKSQGTTAFEVVERSHPSYLISKVDLAPNADRQVYLNGVWLGGIRELRLIPARDVKEIRFVRAVDAGAHGGAPSGGAILVTSKAGR